MRVVHIAYRYGCNNTGGAAIAATRLHLALSSAGIESHYVCIQKCEDGLNVHQLPCGWRRRLFFLLTKLFRGVWKFTPYRESICLNIVPLWGLNRLLEELRPDVVHIQWMNVDVMSFEQVASMKWPMVVHLHDVMPINIVNAIAYADRRFITGLTKENSTYLERWLHTRKCHVVARKKPLFVAPSEWMARLCRESIIGRGCVCARVLNVFDETFRRDPVVSAGKGRFTILFGAYRGRGNPIKGWDDLLRSIALLPSTVKRQMRICVFGESARPYEQDGIEITFAGVVLSAHRMCELYNDADVLAVPSRIDNAPTVKFEALLCGLPVLAFKRTGCAEFLKSGENGWVAPDMDFKAYAKGFLFFYEAWRSGDLREIKERIAGWSKTAFEQKRIVEEQLRVYKQAIAAAG